MQLFLSLDGRIARSEFWLGLAGLIVLSMFLQVVMQMLGYSSQINPQTGETSEGFLIATFVPLFITLWPSICVYGKRYHDRDKSAWWMMIALIPILGVIWMIVELGFLKGTQGPNEYGEDPLA